MDKSIARVLKIKNEIEFSELKIEDCSEYSQALNGYFVVLDAKNVSDVKSFLLKDYKTFEKEILNSFDEFNEKGDTKGLLRILEIYKDGGSYTEAILEENGGLEAILGENVDLGNSINEEEEEMYKEMYEELKAKYESEIKEKDEKIEELEGEVSKSKPIMDVFESLDELEYDDVDMIASMLQEMPSDEVSDLMFDMIEANAKELIEDPSYDIEKLPALKLLMNLIAECIEEREAVGVGDCE